jgi:Xaa-Pro aminopeptidase
VALATEIGYEAVMQNVFAKRREELMRRLGPGAVAVIHGGRLQRRNADADHRFRQTSDLLYLTGFEEPESTAVLVSGRAKPFVLFLRKRDPERETWNGRRLGTEGAVARLQADEAFVIEELPQRLEDLLDGAREVHFYLGDDAETDRLVLGAIANLRGGERKGRRAPTRLCDLRTTLHEMRLIKDEAALVDLRRAVEITVEAHQLAMRATRPGVGEHELEALIDYTFRRRGGAGPGFATIVAGGANATILHYIENSAPLRAGDLVLIDAGGEHAGSTGDISRTFPVNGRFSPLQRRLYDLVLDLEERAIGLVRPGVTIDEIHRSTVERLTAGLVELGVLAGEVPRLVEVEAYKRFYMHRTSHWLGLDVHDAGRYYLPEGPRALEPGMVLTIEPGVYFPADAADLPEEMRGIGIRIEDDVLVTLNGAEVLTRELPKRPDEIEALVGRQVA